MQLERAATKISPMYAMGALQHSPLYSTWDRKVPNTVTLQLPQKTDIVTR